MQPHGNGMNIMCCFRLKMTSAADFEKFFNMADTDNSGQLTLSELTNAMRNAGFRGTDTEIKVCTRKKEMLKRALCTGAGVGVLIKAGFYGTDTQIKVCKKQIRKKTLYITNLSLPGCGVGVFKGWFYGTSSQMKVCKV